MSGDIDNSLPGLQGWRDGRVGDFEDIFCMYLMDKWQLECCT